MFKIQQILRSETSVFDEWRKYKIRLSIYVYIRIKGAGHGKVNKTDREWQRELSPEEYRITRQRALNQHLRAILEY